MKPLGKRAYGSIPHLRGSRLGESESHIHEGQERILTEKKRDKHDRIIVTEKLDGSNCAIARLNGDIIPLTRAGYIANTSPFIQHHYFYDWVLNNKRAFSEILKDGEWLSGEWMIQAHGTKYDIEYPFYIFDLFRDGKRILWEELYNISFYYLPCPAVMMNRYDPVSINDVEKWLGTHGRHGAVDKSEGAVWRCERKGHVDFLAKYVRPNKVDGVYMKIEPPVWNFPLSQL